MLLRLRFVYHPSPLHHPVSVRAWVCVITTWFFWENVAFVYVCFAPTQIHHACKQNIVLYSKRPINGPYSSNTFGTGTKRKRKQTDREQRNTNNHNESMDFKYWIAFKCTHFLHSIHLFGSSSLTQCSHALPFFRCATIHKKLFYWIAEKVSQANVDKIQSLVEPAIGKNREKSMPTKYLVYIVNVCVCKHCIHWLNCTFQPFAVSLHPHASIVNCTGFWHFWSILRSFTIHEL